MKLFGTLRLLVIIAVVILVGAAAIWWVRSPKASRVTAHDSAITDISPMVRLCALDIYEDVPIKASIGTRHMFARATLNGSITFDLENIGLSEQGDTILVTLPREIVEIYESTDPGSYLVIDTWNDRFYGSEHFTTPEENAIKAKVRDNFRRKIYRKGYVRRARAEAADNLTSMLSGLTGKTVIVTDPTPEGSPDIR